VAWSWEAGTNLAGPPRRRWKTRQPVSRSLQVRLRTGDRHIGERKTVDVTVVGDQVQIRVDPRLRRMHETEVANHINNPEIFVAGRRLMIFSLPELRLGGVAELGFDSHNILRVVVNGAGRRLCFAGIPFDCHNFLSMVWREAVRLLRLTVKAERATAAVAARGRTFIGQLCLYFCVCEYGAGRCDLRRAVALWREQGPAAARSSARRPVGEKE